MIYSAKFSMPICVSNIIRNFQEVTKLVINCINLKKQIKVRQCDVFHLHTRTERFDYHATFLQVFLSRQLY